MKKILTLFLAGTTMLAVAQKKSNLSRSIDDDGKKLSIRVSGTIDGREIDFDKSFDVSGMTDEERVELREKILDEIGEGQVVFSEPPAAPQPVAPPAPATPPACAKAPRQVSVVPSPPTPPVFYEKVKSRNREVYTSDNRMHGIDSEHDRHGATFRGLDDSGFRKHVKYNSVTGELFMQYHFKKNDEEFVYEKTVNAMEKSLEERLEIVEKFEKEIELPCDQTEM